ncbi:MAG: hypothetical protein JW982_15460 [Spirochaetes bacterium]|nr:hypothetical protein [Spirochaetota bacterium]
MKKLLLSVLVLFSGTLSISAATIKITNTSGLGVYDTPIDNLQTQVNSSNDLSFLGNNTDFATAMGDSTQFQTSTATFNGYQNYKLFAVSIGYGAGVVIPDTTDTAELEDKLKADGDIKAGAASAVTLNAGINLGLFVDNLYANILLGGFPETEVYDGLRMKQLILGFGLNYSVIDSVSLLGGFAKWRGLSIGSGLYYINSKSSYSFETGEQTTSIGSFDVKVNPLVSFESDISIFKIPVEAVTSLQALWLLNFGFGAGADLSFGKSNFDINAKSDVYETATNTKVGEAELVGAGTEANPTLFKFKLLGSIGFNLGPVKIDFPVVYYPADGLFMGVTTGFIF